MRRAKGHLAAIASADSIPYAWVGPSLETPWDSHFVWILALRRKASMKSAALRDFSMHAHELNTGRKVRYVANPAEFAKVAEAWDALADIHPFYCPDSRDVIRDIEKPRNDIRVFAVESPSGKIESMIAFNITEGLRGHWLLGREIFKLKLRVASLIGHAPLGQLSGDEVGLIVAKLLEMVHIDLIALPWLPVSSAFVAWRDTAPAGYAFMSDKREAIRRTIVLPDDMDRYWEELGYKTRKSTRRELRKFDSLCPIFKIYTDSSAVDEFLPLAAKLSGETYHARIGMDLRNDDVTKNQFRVWLSEGRLFCFLVFVDQKPVAFSWGDVSHGKFYFRQTGYDRSMSQVSAGKMLLIKVIDFFIESHICKVFDFGVRDMDYKERFGNYEIECYNMMVVNKKYYRSMLYYFTNTFIEKIKSFKK